MFSHQFNTAFVIRRLAGKTSHNAFLGIFLTLAKCKAFDFNTKAKSYFDVVITFLGCAEFVYLHCCRAGEVFDRKPDFFK